MKLLFLKRMDIEGNSTSMIKLNNLDWDMWKSMMEDFLTIKDLSDTLEENATKLEEDLYK